MNLRFKALETAKSRKSNYVEPFGEKISEYFACNVFNDKTMEQYLSGEAYEQVQNAIHASEKITRGIADQVAAAMKTWAMSKGATHYTHSVKPTPTSTAPRAAFLATLARSPIATPSPLTRSSNKALKGNLAPTASHSPIISSPTLPTNDPSI